MRIAIIIGTRPEIIKMSPVIRACEELGLDYFIPFGDGKSGERIMKIIREV